LILIISNDDSFPVQFEQNHGVDTSAVAMDSKNVLVLFIGLQNEGDVVLILGIGYELVADNNILLDVTLKLLECLKGYTLVAFRDPIQFLWNFTHFLLDLFCLTDEYLGQE